MPRVPYIEVKDHPELGEAAAIIGSLRGGRLSNIYRVLLHSPGFALAWLHLNTTVCSKSKLPRADQELLTLLVAAINKAQYEITAHTPTALAQGLTRAQIDHVGNWQNHQECYDQRQLAILGYADAMTRTVEVPDQVFDAVHAIFNTQELVELTFYIASYSLVTRLTVALKLMP